MELHRSNMPRLSGQECGSCGYLHWGTAEICPKCGADNLRPIDFLGEGVIYTFTIVRVGFGEMADKVPYVLVIVEMTEGKHLTGILEADPESVAIGNKVQFSHLNQKLGLIFGQI